MGPAPVSTDAGGGLAGMYAGYTPLTLPQTCIYFLDRHSDKGAQRQRATPSWVFSASDKIRHIRPNG